MKKIFLMLVAVFATLGANAQTETALRSSKITDNAFIGVNVGGTWSLLNRHSAFWKNVNPSVAFKIGQYATPNYGIQLEFEGGFGEGNKTLLDHHNLSLDWLFNLSNIIGGYNGSPRKVEVVGFIGAGWFHTYGDYVMNSSSAKTGVEVNFNLGKKKAWQINVVPSFTYLPSNPIDHSYVGLSVGVTYKFKNSNGSHNFQTVRVLDELKWKEVNDEVNRLLAENSRLGNEVAKVKTETVNTTDTLYIGGLENVVSFRLNSAEVDETQMANLAAIAKQLKENDNLKVTVKAYADKETGTSEYNQTLSEERAAAVKNVLVNKFGVDASRVSTLGVGSSEQFYDENNWNRVAVFVAED